MTETQVWLWLMLDNIRVAGILMAVVFAIFSFATIMVGVGLVLGIDCESNWKGIFFVPVGLIMLLVCTSSALIPSTKQYAVVKVLPKLVNSDIAKEATGDIKDMYDMAKQYLKDMMKTEGGK